MSDTISAISTPIGSGGIGVVRVSGDRAVEIADRIFMGKKRISCMKGYTAAYGWIVNPSTGEKIDSVVVLVMKAPHSYTGEDVVEISAHGGQLLLRRILELVLSEGARLAEPGEFTKRAFLNGKLDLSQVEGVANLIYADSMAALRASIRQLEGKLGERIREIRRRLVELVALIEVGNDYYEEDLPIVEPGHVKSVLNEVLSIVKRWLRDYEEATPLREGVNMVIVGKPNVGKSSIMNFILQKERSIVTPIPGTTRDTVEDSVFINGIPFRAIDTAGIRIARDEVESMGIDRTRRAIRTADLILFVVDGSIPLDDNDFLVREELMNSISGKVIGVCNKIDLPLRIKMEELHLLMDIEWIEVSALTGEGMEDLKGVISKKILQEGASIGSEFSFSTPRISSLLRCTVDSLNAANSALEERMPLDVICINVKEAISFLSQVVGEGNITEEVLSVIFSNFCVGK